MTPAGPGRIADVVPTLRVSDIEVSLAFYAMLGFAVEFRYDATPAGPYYAGISRDGHDLHLSTHAGDGVFGTVVYCYVDDVDALFRELVGRGVMVPGNPDSPVEDGPVDQTWGMREFYVRDPDRNCIRFGSPVPAKS